MTVKVDKLKIGGARPGWIITDRVTPLQQSYNAHTNRVTVVRPLDTHRKNRLLLHRSEFFRRKYLIGKRAGCVGSFVQLKNLRSCSLVEVLAVNLS